MNKTNYFITKRRIEIDFEIIIELGYKKYKFIRNSMIADNDIDKNEFENKIKFMYNKRHILITNGPSFYGNYFLSRDFEMCNDLLTYIKRETLLIYYEKIYSVHLNSHENSIKIRRIHQWVTMINSEINNIPSLLELCMYVVNNNYNIAHLKQILPYELIEKIEKY